VVIVSARSANIPYVRPEDRFECDDLGHDDDRVHHLSVRFGFSEDPNLPEALRQACEAGLLENGDIDVADASYFLSRGPIRRTRARGMAPWRKILFLAVARNAADPTAYFGLPPDRTVTMGRAVDL
jgi:KUP system potassium uptake protein